MFFKIENAFTFSPITNENNTNLLMSSYSFQQVRILKCYVFFARKSVLMKDIYEKRISFISLKLFFNYQMLTSRKLKI